MNVRVVCDDCDEVSIPIADLHVRFCVESWDTSFWFICPKCEMRVFSEVHPTKRTLLLTHPGIRAEPWFWPEELRERHDGPPLSSDDVLSLREDLASL